jgi:hypothetical protein
MPPCGEHVDHLCGDLSPGKEHFEHLVPEDALQLFQFKRRGDAEHAPAAVETAIRQSKCFWFGIAVMIATSNLQKCPMLRAEDCGRIYHIDKPHHTK